jgi:hypothetical protein
MHEKMQGEGGGGKGKDQKEIEMAERGDIGCCQVLQMEMEIQAPMQCRYIASGCCYQYQYQVR